MRGHLVALAALFVQADPPALAVGKAVEQLARLFARQHRGLAGLDDVLRPAHRVRRIGRDNLAGAHTTRAALTGLRKRGYVVVIDRERHGVWPREERHCRRRSLRLAGLGHQIGTEFAKEMVVAAQSSGIALPDRELACAPIESEVGRRYLGAMRAAMNCALANREILGHYARCVFRRFFPDAELPLLFDVSHNTCKVEQHLIDGKRRDLFVHRKGATRAFGPGYDNLPPALRFEDEAEFVRGLFRRYLEVGSVVRLRNALDAEKVRSPRIASLTDRNCEGFCRPGNRVGFAGTAWWAMQGSNLRPLPCEGSALPLSNNG